MNGGGEATNGNPFGMLVRVTSHNRSMSRSPARRHGFTLIELLIVIVVVSVLATLALPTYFNHIRKSRRADAVSLIAQVMHAQERWRANQPSYASDFGTSVLNVRTSAPSGITELNEPYYTISIPLNNAAAYSVRAVAAGPQAADAQCAVMEMRMTGGNAQYVSVPQGGDISTATTDPNRCWSR